MASGVAVKPECQQTFQRMAEGKKEFRYIIFKIQDKEITVEKAISSDQLESADDYADNSKAAYEQFVQDLKDTTNDLKECRYAVFDFKFTGSREGAGASKMDKIVFLQVCPDGASVKQKMVYASSAQAIKQALNQGKFVALQISDESEMSHREIFNKLSDKYSDKRAVSPAVLVCIQQDPKSACNVFRTCRKKQASGVKIDPQCKKDYDDMHQRKLYSYLIFRVSDDDTTIIVEKKGKKGSPYSEFVEELRQALGNESKECRYGCVDVEFTVQRQGAESSSSIQKVVFVQICPDDAPVRKRMLYASSVRGLKSALGLESLMQIQASDMSDLDEKAIKHELMSHQRV